MSLPRAVYAELEQVVGPRYISDRPWVLAGVRAPQPNTPVKPPSPEAVLLPGSAEEVQQIVRICNRHGIRYIATVSSLIGFAYPSGPGTIILQLKRMNRLVEINAQDRYAVIEPGVRHGQLRTELMRHGLSYPVAAVGPGGSVLANFACSSGDNHCQHGASRTNRYLLGIEWVTPEGELLRLGSLANDAGWFSADGPGPSLRGLIKGFVGQWGGLGVVTRIAIGLDAWRGPATLPTTGRSPSYQLRLDPALHQAYVFKFPSIEQLRDAMIAIGEAEIAQAVLKYFNASAALLATESANDFWELWRSGLFQRELARPLYVYLSAFTPEEYAYEERVLRDIVAEFGGEDVDERILRIYRDNMDFYILVGALQRVLRLGGGWAPAKLSGDSIGHMIEVGKAIPEFMQAFIAQGRVFDAPDNWQVIPLEYGHGAHIELLFLYDRVQANWGQVPVDFMRASMQADIRNGHHGTMPPRTAAAGASLGPLFSNAQLWAARVKDAFDPRLLANPF
jgi:FAD/FMN-containing dehydrogenase